MRRAICCLSAAIFVFAGAHACVSASPPTPEPEFDLRIDAGKYDRSNTPVAVFVTPAELQGAWGLKLLDDRGQPIEAQIGPPRLDAPKHGPQVREIDFILPKLDAGKSVTYKLEFTSAKSEPTGLADVFHWTDTLGVHDLLSFGSRPVMDYVYRPLDESSKKSRVETYKVFHHVYDSTGKILLTKGPGGQDTHHRGLFFGFNKITYGDPDHPKHADVWQCHGDAYQSHEGFLSSEAGPVLGRHLLAIDWHGEMKGVFAHERREMTAYNVPGGTMIDFAAELTTADGAVKLDGDPQHAGFHFRAPNEVAAKTKKQTYFLRPDSIGKPGESRNWDADHTGPLLVNQPWKGMSFVTHGHRYTAAILDLPTNPKEARSSERPYGRFGSYFEYTVTKDHPLRVAYRFWIQDGEMTQQQIARLADDFVDPPTVVVKLVADR